MVIEAAKLPDHVLEVVAISDQEINPHSHYFPGGVRLPGAARAEDLFPGLQELVQISQ